MHVSLRNITTYAFMSLFCVSAITEACRAQDSTKATDFKITGGIVVAGASAVDPQAKFFLDGAIDIPLVSANANAFLSMWGDGKISSIAQPGALSGVSAISTYIAPVLANPSQMVQSGEVNGGLELRLGSARDADEDKPWSINAIASGGFITPLSPSQAQPQFYVATQDVQNYYSSSANKFSTACNDSSTPPKPQTCYVAFLPQDRSSFYRSYSTGLRFKKYWKDASSGSTDSYLFPAQLDLTIGQNEYVTGGGLKGAVLHVGGSTPLPGYAFVTVGFGADLRVTGVSNTNTSLLLIPPASGTTLTLTSTSVVPIAIPQPDRDRYLFTLTLDLKKIVSLWSSSGK